jgi:hypothetical protein
MNKHDTESAGAKARDHAHPRQHFLKRAHRDWRVWAAVVLMLAMIVTYVVTVDLSILPGQRSAQSTLTQPAP